MVVRGHVKWFDTTKGYGFVVSTDGEGDILLHSNVLRVFGFTSVAEGAEIVLRVQVDRPRPPGRRGDGHRADGADAGSPVRAALPETEAAGPLEPARVKWFDRVKGFGFVNIYGRPEDVFLHMETLRQYGYGEVVAGDVLAVRVTAGPRGPMVYEVRSWDYVVRNADAGRCGAADGLPPAGAGAGRRRCRWPRAADDCAPDAADLRDADTTLRFHVEVMDTAEERAHGPDVPREPAEVLRHALRLRHAAAGGLLDEEHADPARHAVLRRRRPARRGSRARRSRTTRRRSSAATTSTTCSRSTAASPQSSASTLGAELRNPAVEGAAWSCAG